MKPRKGNPDQYLQQNGGTYYARVRVPRTLEKAVGQTHLRQSLGTGNKAEANRLKHEVVAILKARIQGHRDNPAKPEGARLTLEFARKFRQHLQELRASDRQEDEEHASTLEDVASDMADKVEALHGTERAAKFYRAATSTEDSLMDLMGKWLDSSDDKESTKAGHRKALADLLEFLENPEARPTDITQRGAVRFVEHLETNSGLSAVTMGEKLRSVAADRKLSHL